MEQRSSGVKTLRGAKALGAAPGRGSGGGAPPPAGLGASAAPTLGVVPGHRLRRQATIAKGYRHMRPPAALPLFDVHGAGRQRLPCMLRCPALGPTRVRGGD